MLTASDTLSSAEIAQITGKQRAASQAAVLARLGIPFAFSGRSVTVQRLVAQAHQLLPEKRPGTGVDLSRVR